MTNLGKGRAGQKSYFWPPRRWGQRGRGTGAGPECDMGVARAPQKGDIAGWAEIPPKWDFVGWSSNKNVIFEGVEASLSPLKNVELEGWNSTKCELKGWLKSS